ncbi:2735_t:CDS:2 [Racocetra fulgida]|uniref:U2 small nuclear ribonucleoprotein A' n=1 Tax=Racocetra fulgida TaxID=60492 RepID=A0A9N9BB02_9GLOM|nr:2735_t:CDS:2 [Racocetra fulgida]
MKLTPELIERSLSYINSVKDRELDLRENLGVTKDLNDTIDLTDNDIRVLGNFPLLRRVRSLLLANNRITRIDPQIAEFLPNLTTLVLTNNNITEISDLEPLAECKRLKYELDHLENTECESIRFQESARCEAKQLFETAKGEPTSLARSISETVSKTFEPGEGMAAAGGANLPKSNLPTLGMSIEEQAKIREAIRNAKTLEEVSRLETLLQSGHIPGTGRQPGDFGQGENEEMEE